MSMDVAAKGHILWLGDRPNSIGDEPARLRRLGYPVTEVADDVWGRSIKGGVPAELEPHLLQLDVCSPQISRAFADLMNRNFETVVVADSAIWTNELLRVFDRRLVVRAYGRGLLLGAELFHLGTWPIIKRRKNLHHVTAFSGITRGDLPVGAELMAPIWIDESLHRFRDTWRAAPLNGDPRDILISLPVAENSQLARSVALFIRRHFSSPGYRHLYHLGLRDVNDWRKQRERFHDFQNSSGYHYANVDSRQLHMEPLEMMLVGGPVIYFASGPLAQLMPTDSPGCARTIEDVYEKCRLLRQGDRSLIADIQASQEQLLAAYDVASAGRNFDSVFLSILGGPEANHPGVSRSGIRFEPDLASGQIQQLLSALSYEANASAVPSPWSPEAVVLTIYRTVVGIDPDPAISRAHVANLAHGAPPVDVLRAIMAENRMRLREADSSLVASLRPDVGYAGASVRASALEYDQ